jgi:cell division protein FtsW (lipid II flippase)
MLLPSLFHLGWSGLLLLLATVAWWPRPSRSGPGSVTLQLAFAVAVIGWSGAVLSEIAQDHGPGLDVLGYELRPPADGPAVVTLGTSDEADVVLADPHAASVHAVVRWEDGVPTLWNAASDKRIEVDGVELHDVVLRSGMRIETREGGLASGWEVSVGRSMVTLVHRNGQLHRMRAPLLRSAARKAPFVGERLTVQLGRIVGAPDGSLRIAERDEDLLPGDGPVARIYRKGDVARLGFASAADRASHPLRIRSGGVSFRPADRASVLRSGQMLTLGYSKYEVRVVGERVSLIARGRSARLPWPEEATVVGPDPGVLLVGEPDGQALTVASLDGERGLQKVAAVWRESSGGPSRTTLAAGRQLELPIGPGARIRLRTTETSSPSAALAGTTSTADAEFWWLLVALAAAYLIVTLLGATAGLVHARSAGVLHGAAMLFAVGLLCLYRLADPGDPLRVDWAVHQARLGLLGLSVAGVVLLGFLARRRFSRTPPRQWFVRLDGSRGDGAPASRLYLLALVGLALQLPFGEAGIAIPGLGSVQPIEPARTLLVLYLAYWTIRAVEAKRLELRGREGLRERWAYMVHALPVIAVLVLCYGLQDISPILVFVAFVGVLYTMSLLRPAVRLWPPSALRESLGLEALVVPIGAALLAWIVLGDPAGTVARRVAVWWDPWSRGDDAYQALTALWTAASGGVWGLGWIGDNGVLPPAVKDDFILALLAARGGAAAVTLVAATFGVILLSGVAALSSDDGLRAPAERERSGVLGGAMLWMLVLQAGVVLGSATGGLPVMGQPLPFVAAAGSHLLFFCIPAVAVVLVTSRRGVVPVRRRAGVSRRLPHPGPITGPISLMDEPITMGGG